MTGESKRKRRPKRRAWSGDRIVDAFVQGVKHEFGDIGRGNAIRLLLGRPPAKGLVFERCLLY